MMVIPILTTIAWVLSFLFTSYALYYAAFSIFAFRKSRSREVFAARKRFAVIIAARNEACVIGNLVESLFQQQYPRELYDVIVVPNNCTDSTKEVALSAGARIIECAKPVKSKGDALQQTLQQLFDTGADYDAICVVDADNLVAPQFLQEMNNALCAGARAAQGYRDSKNPFDTAISGCYSIYYWMINRMYNHTRSALGLSAMINGSGFMVSLDLLRELGGWNTVTMTEDIEFTTQCILYGVQVAWVPEAVIYDEQPLTFAQSWKQRKRWSTGIFQGCSVYFGRLFKSAVKSRRVGSIDQMVFFIAPYMQLVYVLSLVLGLVLNLLYINHRLFPETELYYRMFLSINVSYFLTTAMAVLVIVIEQKGNLKLLKGVAAYWLFILSWIPINLVCFFRRCTTWEEIKHTRSVHIADVTGSR